jgi:hypothetical protein
LVQAAAPLDFKHTPDAVQLRRLVGRLRLRLGLERAATWALRGVAASALAFSAISLVGWLTGESISYTWATGPLVLAVAIALTRWPSNKHAAREGDRRLGLEERLATAIELAERGPRGRFDGLQVRDAVGAGQRTSQRVVRIDGREVAIAVVLVGVAALSLLLRDLPRPTLPLPNDQQLPMLELTDADGQARAEVTDLPELSQDAAAQAATQQAQADPNLANRVELEQAERDALDRLSQALGRVSAAQPAADAIQRGDFSSARDLLSNLGEEADQLSDAAKQQLARSLQQAANATASTDRALADRERQAATALSRSNYNEQRQALRNLADQVEKSGARSPSNDQLARDVGRLQQQASTQQQQAQSPSGQGQPNSPVDAATAPASAGQAPAADGGANAQGTQGQQGGPGIGTGAGGDPIGDRTNRLDSVGQSVEVPQKLGPGPGVRPTDGTEDQLGNDPSANNRAVSELVQAQQTGQVTPEQNLVPHEQRPVVRGYFH